MADRAGQADNLRNQAIEVVDDALRPSAEECMTPNRCLFGSPDRVVDALFAAGLFDQAAHNGAQQAAEAIEAVLPGETVAQRTMRRTAAHLARAAVPPTGEPQ